MSKHYNPLLDNNSVKSESGAKGTVESTSAFVVDSANYCPKCSSSTVPTKLLSGEDVMFCTGCRVSLAIPLQ
ncbi:DNA ligase [Dickeya phage vB_DsoM_AD1]|uniref:Uncharacterized protein n=1 Tax=Dickeya phage vB_DsoM_AD1 TaxID=2283029 RepID=A0A384ZXV3_9CAUD|nr:DNA ligase [Dickeya phage vB_DsoM_AD1]AXG67049.1 hypothetical protein AD1_005 [Dickeya phage vB_DsoM_AD1]